MSSWHLDCSACDHTQPGDALASVCPLCGQPFLVHYDSPWPSRESIQPRWDMWRYGAVLPLAAHEEPVSLGEGTTPMRSIPTLAKEVGVATLIATCMSPLSRNFAFGVSLGRGMTVSEVVASSRF